ncbi:MAG: endolytic transglycosylase MltG [Pseudobdellovibrionaceae bacterium]
MLRRIALIVLLLAALCAGGVYYAAQEMVRALGPLAQQKIVLIPKGTGSQKIGEILEREGIISSRFVFYFAAWVSPEKAVFQAGEYEFAPHVTIAEVITKMRKGDVFVRRFTIPEGRTSYEIVEVIKAIPELTGSIVDVPAEGTLYPDTYSYTAGDDRVAIIDKLRVRMTGILQDVWAQRASDTILKTPEEALTLASIVEKETGKASERAMIAGVFINRLQKGIPLQSDPTVIYAVTGGRPQNEGQGPLGRRLLTKDLDLDSPYNTYKNVGLPPAPIASPGRAAIEAVLHPAKHNFLFFVADGTGGHLFAVSLAEHNRNVAQWRVLRRAQQKD